MKLRNYLPSGALSLGLVCYYLRRLLYAMYADETGLLKTGTALEWGVYALTALSLLLFAAAARKPMDLTPNPAGAAVGQLIGGLGLGWTALRYPGEMPGMLGNLWRILGIASALCLIWSAWCTWRKKNTSFLLPLVPCLFWLVHMVDNYQGWSGQPQMQSYLFALLATMFMALFTYYIAAESVALGKPRRKVFSALSAGFLCLAAILGPEKTQPLWLSCAIWAVTSLYAPAVKNPKKTE
ncbi:MAG: hypothetical protein Q4F81_08760 [Eubacteriales bacterium]|nr:hypothetical protein [Eubacteriales bacterium]